MGSVVFGAPRDFVLFLRDAFDVKTFVETGTFEGETAEWASRHFAQVFTIEGFEPLHRSVVARHGHLANVRFLLGDSRNGLESLAAETSAPVIFWLDAHYCGDGSQGSVDQCPLLDELEVVVRRFAKPLVLVDDARLFVAPPPVGHIVAQWPSLLEVCSRLGSLGGGGAYAAIRDDVIVGVPAWARERVVDFLHLETSRRYREELAAKKREALRFRNRFLDSLRWRLGI